jgi:hypothetical protein
MDTVEELVPLIEPYVGASGSCGDFNAALQRINDCRRILWNKGDFEHTTSWFRICCAEDCVTLPSQYKQIRIAFIGDNPTSLGDEWYQSVYGETMGACEDIRSKLIHVGGYHVTFRNYNKAPYIIRVFRENQQDQNVTITFRAKAQSGAEIDIPITMATEYTDSAQRVAALLRVTKPVTKGRVRVYAYNPDLKEYLLLAVYMPGDVNPHFERYRIRYFKPDYLTIQAKKKFFNLTQPHELVEFNSDAMIEASLALNYREARELDRFANHLAVAVAEQNRESADREIPSASPLRIGWDQRVTNLVGWSGCF